MCYSTMASVGGFSISSATAAHGDESVMHQSQLITDLLLGTGGDKTPTTARNKSVLLPLPVENSEATRKGGGKTTEEAAAGERKKKNDDGFDDDDEAFSELGGAPSDYARLF
jgi:hypothetical protein